MEHGHFMGYGYNGSIILLLLLVFAVVLFYLLLRDYFKSKNSPVNGRILETLKQRYVKNEISADEYMERKMLMEDEDYNDPAIFILKERYAFGEINAKEFVERVNEINKFIRSDADILKEQYARGEITVEEFRQRQKAKADLVSSRND